MEKASAQPALRKRQILLTAGLISMLIALGGFLFFSVESGNLHADNARMIKAIADQKVSQITQWQKEKISDIRVISRSPFFAQATENWCAHPANGSLKRQLHKRLQLLKVEYEMGDVCIAAPDGRLLMSLDSTILELDPFATSLIKNSVQNPDVTLSDLYSSPSDEKIHYDLIAPIRDENNKTFALLLFRIDPYEYLYPLIQSWPTPSKTSETVILRRDGDSVVFLNDLRLQKNCALTMRRALTDKTSPGVQAVLNTEGIFEGLDYRGVKVVAYLARVPHTEWYLVAKVDHTEIYAELYFRAAVISFITITMILFVGAWLTSYYRSHQKNMYRALFHNEKKLREYHEEFRTILYSIGDGVITTDLDGLVKQMNPIAASLTGWNETDAEGRHFDEVFTAINERTRHRVESPITHVLRERTIVGLANHTLLVSKNGNEIPIADSGAPICNDRGEISGTVLVFRDKTDEHRAETKLRESEKLYRSLFENMLNGFAYCQILLENGKPHDFIYLAVNAAFESQTGLKNVAGRKVSESIPGFKERDPELLEAYGRVALTRVPDRFERFVDSLQMWFSISVYSPAYGYFVAVFDVITERKHAEQALREDKQNFKTLADSGQALIWLSGTDKLCTYFNHVWLEFTGRTLEQEMGNGWAEGVHPDDLQRCFDTYIGAFNRREKFSMEYRLLRHDKEYRWLLDDGCPRYNSTGDFIGYIGHCLDITERKLAQESMDRIAVRLRQSEKMEAVGLLAGGIAHDFNNVLGGIIGFADLSLEYAETGSPLENNLRMILKAGDRAKHLVQQILTFSRQSNPQRSVITIRPIIEEVIELLRASVPLSVTIVLDLNNDTKPVLADATQIHEALLNLATNAVYAMNRKGTLTVRLFSRSLSHEETGRTGPIARGAYTIIEVTDTGCGMDEATLSKAFEPFYTTKAVGEGTGMGLSVVLGVVQSHEGDLQVESTPGKGTSIRIYLPVSNESVASADTKNFHSPMSGTERILFVDDEPVLVELAQNFLTPLGYTVTGLSNGLDALSFIDKNRADIDVLVTDQNMPGMTGVELAKEALKINKDLLVILCTGFSNEINSKSAAGIGIKRFLMKPYRTYEIVKSIRDLIDAPESEMAHPV
jgi:two-component system, cell cycle sensor histidine kinase and response regulator CckA